MNWIKLALGASASMVSLYAAADEKQNCVAMGRVVKQAMLAEVHQRAYGERADWRSVEFYMLPQGAQDQVEADVVKLRPTAGKIVESVMKDVAKWKRQGMNGDSMARQILARSGDGLDEMYAVECIKAVQRAKAPSEPSSTAS